MIKKEYLFLGLILVFFLFTRFFKITQIPASVYWDEASIGYNAYSILQDAKDEWGNLLPLHFRAFGEFKLPVYIYSVAASEFIFGPGIFSIRFPSVVYSALSLILIYLIGKKLFGARVGLFSALVFAVSPWYFIFSRVGYEVSAGLSFFLLGILLFLHSEKKSYLFPLSVLSFIFSFYSYNSFRIIIPIFLVLFGFIFLFRKQDKVEKKLFYLILSAVVFLAVLFPIYRLYKFDAGSVRMDQVRASGSVQIIKNYFSHFSYSFLFGSGDSNPRSNFPGFGGLYLAELPFFLTGIFFLIKKRVKFWWLPILAILIGPIPAAITKESPHALRSILMFPFLSIVIGAGMDRILIFIKKYREIVVFGMVCLLMISFENYYSNFLTEYFPKYSTEWQNGYYEIFKNYSSDLDRYESVIITDKYAQPYIFALYYKKFDPQDFRESVSYNPVDNWGFSTVRSFGKFTFKKAEEDDLKEGVIIFADPGNKIENENPIGTIKNLDGSIAFLVYAK